jgi:MipA family protein
MHGISHQHRMRFLTLFLAVAGLQIGHADQQPLWDFGLGVGAIAFDDYRGANTTHVYVLPLPYFYYRGKFLRADRNGVRGLLFNQDWIELNISGNATTPVRRNATRAGMPDLRSTLEVGPSVELHLWKSQDARVKFDVRLPLRAAFTVQSPPHSIGWTFAPYAAVDVKDVAGFVGWYFGALAGPLFASHRYNDYFYTVAPQYATAERPAYQAGAGYSGAEILASLSKRYPSFWVGAYVRHDSLAGATFEASPLVKTREYWAGGFGIAWMISHSSRLVDADE